MADEELTRRGASVESELRDLFAPFELSPEVQRVLNVINPPNPLGQFETKEATEQLYSNLVAGIEACKDREAERIGYAQERGRLKALGEAKTALSERTEAGYLEVIGALARALADLKPEELKRSDGSPLVGYSKQSGDRGIVGYLKSNGYSSRSDGDLQKKISAALKLHD